MSVSLSPNRASIGGSSIIMACACGTASSSMKLLALAGIGVATKMIHPAFFGVGAALIVYGLWRTARQSAYLAIGAFAILGMGAWLTPPSRMTMAGSTMAVGHPGIPWAPMQMLGGSFYLIGIALLAYAFWRAFPARKPGASAAAIGGMALATGCTCCLVEGAIAGMAVTAGASAALETSPIIFWGALAVVAVGLFRLGGFRAAMWVPAGGIIIKFSGEALKLATGDWMVGGFNMRFAPSYLMSIAGVAVIIYGFVKAYRDTEVLAISQPSELALAA